MDRRSFFLTVPVALLAGFGRHAVEVLAAPPSAAPNWLLLGRRRISPIAESVDLNIPSHTPRLTKIRAKVRGEGLWVYDVRANYRGGRQQLHEVRLRVLPGCSTPEIHLDVQNAPLSRVGLTVELTPLDRKASAIELWGLPG